VFETTKQGLRVSEREYIAEVSDCKVKKIGHRTVSKKNEFPQQTKLLGRPVPVFEI
jgi:hypothetical protein